MLQFLGQDTFQVVNLQDDVVPDLSFGAERVRQVSEHDVLDNHRRHHVTQTVYLRGNAVSKQFADHKSAGLLQRVWITHPGDKFVVKFRVVHE